MPTRIARLHHSRMSRAQRAAAAAVAALWDGMSAVDQATIARFAAEAGELVASARGTVVSQTDGYFASYLQAVGVPAEPMGLDPADYTRPVEDFEVYMRPHQRVYRLRDDGVDPAAARVQGRVYAAGLAATDVQLASRGAAHTWTSTHPSIQGYRRVPEVDACDFCALVATRVYQKRDLLEIHPHCRCSVAPMTRDHDPGAGMSPDEVELSDGDVTTVEHGELGPVLWDPGHEFTGPGDIAA